MSGRTASSSDENHAAGPAASGFAFGEPLFGPGDILAGRFRLVRFLAHGGMGLVYEAEDLALGDRVALKTIRGEVAGDPRVLRRFKREISLARRVTHANVCRIFDLYHHGGEAASGGVTFLAMELLAGETLAARLARAGPMPTEEALPLVEQIAQGLHAAHQAGIVHRDLKPSNVILVDAPEGTRAVVSDFGLAFARADNSTSSLTGSMGMVGTCTYMSPEQVEGGDLTPASDVYALGVVAYEMVTGVKPFMGDTPLATAVMRLKQPPPPPRAHRPDLDPRWEAAILRCLKVSPGDRFATAAEVPRFLDAPWPAEPGPTPVAPWPAARRHRVTLLLAAAVAVGGALQAALPALRSRSADSPSSRPAVLPRRSVALLGFKNLSRREENGWLSTALVEMLGAELAAGQKLRVIPGENVARMKMDLSLVDTDSLAPDTLGRVGMNIGTDLVVLGSYLAVGNSPAQKIRIDLRVQDTDGGEMVASVTETGQESDLIDLVSRAGERLRARLGVTHASASEAQAVRASLPANPEAVRLYSEGLAKLRSFDVLGARDLLQRAVSVETDFPLAHAALADAWAALGYDARAAAAANRALELSGRLTREERVSIEARRDAAAGQWGKAIEAYRTLWEFFPDNLEYGLQLAAAQTSGGRGKDALSTVSALRRLPPPMSADPRIDLAEAVAAGSWTELARQREAAARAVEKGLAQGSPLLTARARLSQANALRSLGESEKAAAAFDAAQRIFAKAGDRRGVAEALYGMGQVHFWGGRFTEASPLFQASLDLNTSVGHQRGAGRCLTALGAVYSVQRNHAAAATTYEKALAIHREAGFRTGIAYTLTSLSYTLVEQGHLGAAAHRNDEALALLRELGDEGSAAAVLNNMAWLSWERGDFSAARRELGEALATNRRTGYRSYEARNLYSLGMLQYSAADLTSAARSHEESRAIRRQLGEVGPAMENTVALAAIKVEEGQLVEAESLAREAVETLRRIRDAGEEIQARTVLIQCLLARGEFDEADQSSRRAVALARQSQGSRRLRLAAAIPRARVLTASGRHAEAERSLRQTVAETRRAGFVRLEYDARLALGEVLARGGKDPKGRAELHALAREAEAREFHLIARKATAAADAPLSR